MAGYVRYIWTPHNAPTVRSSEFVGCGKLHGAYLRHQMQPIEWMYEYVRDEDGTPTSVLGRIVTTLQCMMCLIKTDIDGRIL